MDRRTRAERRTDARAFADVARAVELTVADAARAVARAECDRRADLRARARARAAAIPILDVADFDADALLDSLD